MTNVEEYHNPQPAALSRAEQRMKSRLEAINSLIPLASETVGGFTMLLAKMFGVRHVEREGEFETTSYIWRGKQYIAEIHKVA